ncbi:MAG: deoxyguanosinetriphosphate triphosphohydrolase [candidate division Zixibacteria bacterium]|nr:deoxyguanosinetriphosphate triphosphohydrolase [candidate division Zixibacteria bacterium]
MALNKRGDIEKREEETLAGYAALSSRTRGRVYPQNEHPLRTAFQRDRDRIVHSAAFRRMEYKTQVFLPHEGDHFRTRLTHTIEVAQISRTMARSLRLNEDLTEAIALVHDVGHTPFGHIGEDVLNELLKNSGGFNHNRQSLRVVDILEQRYPEHPGLNLTYEVREGIVKHETSVVIKHPDFDPDKKPTLEASIVDIADEIAYNGHDIDDGINSGIIGLDELKELSVWSRAERNGLDNIVRHLDGDRKRYALVRYLVNLMTTDALGETERRIENFGISDIESLRNASEKICRYSPELEPKVAELKKFLKEKLYRHIRLMGMHDRTKAIIETLFEEFKKEPSLMPPRFQEMLMTERADIVIADYIAGMTDRYAERQYEKLK